MKEFHDVVSIEEARKIISNFKLVPKIENIKLEKALGRVLAENISAPIDVPPFDRAAMDGYAVLASDTFYASEENPAKLKLVARISAGESRKMVIQKGRCMSITTGAPIPKGANAVVMVEYTEENNNRVKIYRPVAPGENVAAAGSDIMRGELVLRKGTQLSPRETGVLAALGITEVKVWKKPKVGIISTGDEIIEPGDVLQFGKIYDINARTVADAVAENGGEAEFLGVAKDEEKEIIKKIGEALNYDIIISSGGTSAGKGDMCYKAVEKLGKLIVHGIAVKPGKPTAVGIIKNRLIFCLPGYPTPALMIFNLLIAPAIRELACLPQKEIKRVKALTATKFYSARGRREYMPVGLVKSPEGLSAYPILTGSGAITTLADADGYVEITENTEIIPEGRKVEVMLLSEMLKIPELNIIGSHCLGIDALLEISGINAKVINVGSSGGLRAIKHGDADIAGVHLFDGKKYNISFLKKFKLRDVYLIRGYSREQGILTSKKNPKKIKSLEDLLNPKVTFINRNTGSGTRMLLDLELRNIAQRKKIKFEDMLKKINGYDIEAKSHTAVGAAIAYGRADAGIAIKSVAAQYNLNFIPLKAEEYDFVVPKKNIRKPALQKFLKVLASKKFKIELMKMPGFKPDKNTGKIIARR